MRIDIFICGSVSLTCSCHINVFLRVSQNFLWKLKNCNLKYVGSYIQVCAAAFVFFKTRYAAVVTSQVLQSSNPMLWVTDMAPEPNDVYWSNLWIPYGQLWIRKIATLLAAIAFMLVFLIPVTFVQGLTQLEFLQAAFPFLRGLLKK